MTNFSKLGDNPIQATVRLKAARLHTMHYTTIGIREYSQWFKGEANVVADTLSRDNDRSNNKLTLSSAPIALHRFHNILRFNPCPTKSPRG